ncbi:MAG: hypothetical protein JNK02_09105 [Planctomycetes bacterium]|nr:hypothetical protein [Planctomycetota bacterium]
MNPPALLGSALEALLQAFAEVVAHLPGRRRSTAHDPAPRRWSLRTWIFLAGLLALLWLVGLALS